MRLGMLSLLLPCLALLGCGGKVAENKDEKPEGANNKQEAVAEDEIKIQVKSWEETQSLATGKKGKVVVVDLWALW